ncbi:MAG: hypothetical protein KAX30_08850 [Candidatus Atribacteria bacterium]|nr:hypothetical protein [Candidatus Atribacteria bacterium]
MLQIWHRPCYIERPDPCYSLVKLELPINPVKNISHFQSSTFTILRLILVIICGGAF